MIEKIIKKSRKIVLSSLLGISMFNLGCRTYSPVDQDKIKVVNPFYVSETKLSDDINLIWQEAIKNIQTPEEAQEYLDKYFKYDDKDIKGETFKVNHSDKTGVCLDYATAAAALLSDNNYPALMLVMGGPFRNDCHAIFLYKTEKGFGALGNTPLEARYESIENIVRGYNETYMGKDYRFFFVADLDKTFLNKEWIDGNIKTTMSVPFNQPWIKLKEKSE